MALQARAMLRTALAFSILLFGLPAEAKKEYCAFLAPEDFKAAGVAGAGKPSTAEQAEIAKITGKVNYTSLGVKRGKVVFHIGVPTTPKSEEAVLALARLVLQRTDKLGR